MNDEVLVKVEGVSKKFCRSLKRSLWYGVQDVASEMLGREGHHDELRKNEFWAVQDVSFELKRGECLGLIGPNGAGKSTLLKMLNGLVKPDRGRITMRGRIGALIELGAGFNPILTGRENVYINGSVLGFSKKEIDRKFDAIVDFAEIEEFIDTPVQNYSSGMKVRLGFAVAAQMEPDVLLIDEVLAVGDVGFRAKCYGKIAELLGKASVVFVSHHVSHIARLSNTVLVLEHGRAEFHEQVTEGISFYLSLFDRVDSGRHGSGELKVREFLINGARGNVVLEYGKPVTLEAEIQSLESVNSFVANIAFLSLDGQVVAECNNFSNALPLSATQRRRYQLEIVIPSLMLNPGIYDISWILASANMVRHFDWCRRCRRIEVRGGLPSTAPVQFQGSWSFSDVGTD